MVDGFWVMDGFWVVDGSWGIRLGDGSWGDWLMGFESSCVPLGEGPLSING